MNILRIIISKLKITPCLMKKTLLFLLIFTSLRINAQTYLNPNSGDKSHPTLEIAMIEKTNSYTIVTLEVKNKSSEGDWFCADKNIYLKNSIGKEKYKLIKSENIPICPNVYSFTFVGEILKFKLYFPPIASSIKYLDLIENCNNACFYFKSIILNNDINIKIETGINFYKKKQLQEALNIFIEITKKQTDYNYGVMYFNVIKIYSVLNKTEEVDKWYAKLNSSKYVDKNRLMAELKKQGIIEDYRPQK